MIITTIQTGEYLAFMFTFSVSPDFHSTVKLDPATVKDRRRIIAHGGDSHIGGPTMWLHEAHSVCVGDSVKKIIKNTNNDRLKRFLT